ncbi:MAG: hypothetical protein KDK45_14795 [Leptospiraceae bacterium]|nr:hypothetical protein [Leptospiraceae bacterium]
MNRLESEGAARLLNKESIGNISKSLKTAIFKHLKKERLDPDAFHFLARAYFFDATEAGLDLNATFLLKQASGNKFNFNLSRNISLALTKMYKSALRARALVKDRHYSGLNRLFILLHETFEARKKKKYIMQELEEIDIDSIPSAYKKLYLWLHLYGISQSGKIEKFQKFENENQSLPVKQRIQFSERERAFLSGIVYFYNKDYIKSLSFLRKARTEKDLISLKAMKLEARIFYKQNLPDKAIHLLEDLYKQTEGKDSEILDIANRIFFDYPELKKKSELKDVKP